MHLLPIMIALATVTSGTGLSEHPARCEAPDQTVNDPRGVPAKPRKLAELPPANLYLTVYRIRDGCPDPLIVRTGIGANADRVDAPLPQRSRR